MYMYTYIYIYIYIHIYQAFTAMRPSHLTPQPHRGSLTAEQQRQKEESAEAMMRLGEVTSFQIQDHGEKI